MMFMCKDNYKFHYTSTDLINVKVPKLHTAKLSKASITSCVKVLVKISGFLSFVTFHLMLKGYILWKKLGKWHKVE